MPIIKYYVINLSWNADTTEKEKLRPLKKDFSRSDAREIQLHSCTKSGIFQIRPLRPTATTWISTVGQWDMRNPQKSVSSPTSNFYNLISIIRCRLSLHSVFFLRRQLSKRLRWSNYHPISVRVQYKKNWRLNLIDWHLEIFGGLIRQLRSKVR